MSPGHVSWLWVSPNRVVTALIFAITATSPGGSSAASVEEHGTWSLVASDPGRAEVGVAFASCVSSTAVVTRREDGYRVSAVAGGGTFELVHLVPGRGAAVAQAETDAGNGPRLDRAASMLRTGAPAAAVIAAARDGDAGDARRQYGAVTMVAPSHAVTGADVPSWAGHSTGATFSVQGNTLVAENVVADARAAFEASRGQLADRLLAGLKAGDAAGGDNRCPDQGALVAFLVVVGARDDGSKPKIWSEATVIKGGKRAVAALDSRYAAIRPKDTELPVPALVAGGALALLLAIGLAVWYARRSRAIRRREIS